MQINWFSSLQVDNTVKVSVKLKGESSLPVTFIVKFMFELAILYTYIHNWSLQPWGSNPEFTYGGYVNKQNCRIWGTKNPHAYIQKPTHSKRVTVWREF